MATNGHNQIFTLTNFGLWGLSLPHVFHCPTQGAGIISGDWLTVITASLIGRGDQA